MSRKEYAFRTEGGNLSRTSLYGATDLGLPKKSKGEDDLSDVLGGDKIKRKRKRRKNLKGR